MRLPGRGSFPRVDDHLVEAEVTRDEIIGGQRVVASPAEWPHATQQAAARLPPPGSRGPWLQRGGGPAHPSRRGVGLRHRRLRVQGRHRSRDGRALSGGDRLRGGLGAEREVRDGEGPADAPPWRAADLHDLGQGPAGLRVVRPRARAGARWIRDSWIEDPCLVAPLSVAALLDAAWRRQRRGEGSGRQGQPGNPAAGSGGESQRNCRVHPQVPGRARYLREPGATRRRS